MDSPFVSLHQALTAFVSETSTQGQAHIKPLHRHIVQRLVLEGGFRPEHLRPRPPLRVESAKRKGGGYFLSYDASSSDMKEQTVLGGLKTKDVDVVLSQRITGPCLAVSVKGTFNAFRNLTNRMEEAAGDCTNLHIAYPALVYGFLHVMRANRAEDVSQSNDIALLPDSRPVESIIRYHDAMARITNRSDLRNDVSRYEAVALALIHPRGDDIATIVGGYPAAESPLIFDAFFAQLYRCYDLRFVYSAPSLKRHTARLEWDRDSPVVEDAIRAGFEPRIDGGERPAAGALTDG